MAANPDSAIHPGADSALDKDTQETREWMDALSAVIESEGPERAHFLLEQLLEHARQNCKLGTTKGELLARHDEAVRVAVFQGVKPKGFEIAFLGQRAQRQYGHNAFRF